MFDKETLREYDCIKRKSGTKSKSMVANLLKELTSANEEKEKLHAEIASLKEEARASCGCCTLWQALGDYSWRILVC